MKQFPQSQAHPASFIDGFLKRLRSVMGRSDQEGGLRETLEDLLEEEEPDEKDDLEPEARMILLNALSFGELRVEDVMVPRPDINGIEVGSDLTTTVEAMTDCKHARLLVYRETLDDVLGVVHVKDLMRYWGGQQPFDLMDVLRPVLVVPPSMPVLDLLVEMRQSGTHMAVMVDEFGGTDGLVTLADMVAEIVGDIQDEDSTDSGPQMAFSPDGVIEADARLELDALEEHFEMPLFDEDEHDEADTVAGLIFALVDQVPEAGEVVDHKSGLRFTVLEADPRRILRVKIETMRALTSPRVAGTDE